MPGITKNKNLLASALSQILQAREHAGARPQIPGRIELKAKGEDTAELYIYGDIGESWWGESITAMSVVEQLNALDPAVKTIDVYINSYGGSVTDGLAIYNALKRKAKNGTTVNTSVDGIAASIASLIMMAGAKRSMAANTRLMVHAPWGGLYVTGNSADVREAASQFADLLDGFADAMAHSYAAATGKPFDEMFALLDDGQDHWYSASQAKAAGFCTEIVEEPEEQDAAAQAIATLVAQPAFAKYFDRMPMQLAASLRIPNPAQGADTHSPAAAGASPPARAGTHEEPTMPNPNQTPAADVQAVADKARTDAMAAVRDRALAINAALDPHIANPDIRALRDAALMDPEADTAEEVSAKALKILGKGVTAVNTASRVEAGEDQRDKIVAAGTTALMARAAVQGEGGKIMVVGSDNPFRGMTLMDMARSSCVRAGVRIEGMDPRAIVAAAFTQSGSDFPILLENAIHKTLLTAYQTAPDTWSRFCAIGSVGDFRAHNRYRVGSIGNLDPLNELGEFKNKAIPDGEKASITADTKGNIINISRQAIINDDLGAFIGLAVALGRAGRRTIEAYVYALLALNSGNGPTMSDGLTLFHATHGNLAAAGAVPSVTTFDAGRQAIAAQKDVGNNDFLNLAPAIWLGPMSQGGNARVINGSEYDPDAANKLQRANMVKGMVRDVVDTPRLTGTGWHLFADPNEAPVLEVAFLNGDQNPFLESEDGFDVDGSRFKARLDFGVAAIDYRGAYRNPGA